MQYSIPYIRDINRAFDFESRGSMYFLHDSPSPIFNKFLVIDTSKEEFELPTIVLSRMSNLLLNEDPNVTPKYAFPLYVGQTGTRFRTADSLIRSSMSCVSYSNRLTEFVQISTHDKYYGGKGILFDKNFNLLLICTYRSSLTVEPKEIKLKEKIVHISPRVFLDSNNFINKNIVKKLLPYLLESNIRVICGDRYLNDLSGRSKPKILIDDYPDLISSPKLVPQDTPISDTLNVLLLEHIEDLV